MCLPKSVPRWLQTCLQRLPPRIQQHLQTAQVRLSNWHHDGNRKDGKVRFKRCIFSKEDSHVEKGCCKKCTLQCRKVDIRYNPYTVSWHCSCRTNSCCFSLAFANILSIVSSAILSNFFANQWTENNPQHLSGLSRALFPTTLLEIAVYYSGTPLWRHPLNTDTRV